MCIVYLRHYHVESYGHGAVATRGSLSKLSACLREMGLDGEARELLREAEAARQDAVRTMEWRRFLARAGAAARSGKLAPGGAGANPAAKGASKESHPREWAIFTQIDINGDGAIDLQELEAALGRSGEAALAQQLLPYLDIDGDGVVGFEARLGTYRND